jgi:hypothetical protein
MVLCNHYQVSKLSSVASSPWISVRFLFNARHIPSVTEPYTLCSFCVHQLWQNPPLRSLFALTCVTIVAAGTFCFVSLRCSGCEQSQIGPSSIVFRRCVSCGQLEFYPIHNLGQSNLLSVHFGTFSSHIGWSSFWRCAPFGSMPSQYVPK